MDSESLITNSNKVNSNKVSLKNLSSTNDLTDMCIEITKKVNWKIMILLFIIVLIINSDLFIENILYKINTNLVVNGNELNSNGIIVQGLIVSGSYVLLSIFDNLL